VLPAKASAIEMNHTQPWTVLGIPIDSVAAPDGGAPFGTEAAPAALRRRGLVARLGADDAGDLDVRVVGPERDWESGLVGWPSLAGCITGIRDGVTTLLDQGRRPFLLGGCCALVMGAAAAARDVLGTIGVVNVDGHIDLYDHLTSPTGEAADVPIAALLGRGWPGLLDTMAPMPVVQGADVVVLGARDADEAADLGDLPDELGLTVYGVDALKTDPSGTALAVRSSFREAGLKYWMHLDVDVLDEVEFPATDYLMPGGLTLAQLLDVLTPLATDPNLAGASVGCYNPSKDPSGRYGDALTDLIVAAFGSSDAAHE
jgi:arginase